MEDVITGMKLIIDGSSELDALGSPQFYPYSVPSNASFPYIGVETANAKYWTTLGSVSDGYNIPMRLIVYSHQNVGGSKKSKQVTQVLESLFNKNEFSISSGNVIYCMLDGKSMPFENPEDPDYYYQYIDFKIITERS